MRLPVSVNANVPESIATWFRQFATRINAVWTKEHHAETGAHVFTQTEYLSSFQAGDFTGNVAGSTWTVAASNLTTLAYVVIGKMVFLSISIASTGVAGAPTSLMWSLPAGLTPRFGSQVGMGRCQDNGVVAEMRMFVAKDGTTLNIQRKDLAAFAASAAGTSVVGQIWWEFV